MNITVAKDLRPTLGPARHQHRRPTCLAFAASDAHAAARGAWAELSSEYLFYHAQKRAGRPPGTGALLGSVLASLRDDGQPLESGWPYLPTLPANLKSWKPPASVGPVYVRGGTSDPSSIDSAIAALNSCRTPIVLLKLSRTFFQPLHGGIVDAGTEEPPDDARRHAVVAVGHGEIAEARAILVRNSWGATWGISGHAWLTERWLGPRIYAMATFT